MTATLPHPRWSRRAALDSTQIEIGESVYKKGLSNGIEPASWEIAAPDESLAPRRRLRRRKGGGFKSLNVTVRKTLADVRQRSPLRFVVSLRRDQTSQGWTS